MSTDVRRLKRNVFPVFMILSIFLFPYLSGHGQSLSKYDSIQKLSQFDKVGISIGPTFLFKNSNQSIQNIDYLIQPSFLLSYQKNINTFVKLRGRIGWQPVSSKAFNVDPDPSIRAGTSGGSIFSAEVMPLLFTNPDQVGYLPSEFKFYLGLGLGMFYSSVRNPAIQELSDNDLALIEYGLFEEEKVRNLNFSPYIPFSMGIVKNLGETLEIGAEFSLIYSFSTSLIPNQPSQNFLPQFQILLNKKLNK